MQENIHPNYHAIKVTCSCGHSFETRSTIAGDDLSVEVCSKCHPFYTGKQKTMSTGGRMEKFKSKYARFGSKEEKA